MTTRATQLKVSPLAGKRHGKGCLRLKGMPLEYPDLVCSAGTSRPRVSLPTGWPTRLRRTCRALLLAGLMGAALPASAATLRWAAQTEITSLDPHAQAHPQVQAVLQHVYESLTRYSPGLEVEPALAQRWELLTPVIWRFHLRQGVRFHDGSPLTAEDVQFSLERLKGAGSTLGTMLAGVRSVRRIDEQTIDIVLDKPMPLLPRILTDARIMNRRWARTHRAEAVLASKPGGSGYATRNANGTGPYRVAEGWAPGLPLQLERNPDWWNTGGFPGNADPVIYQAIASDDDRLRALERGEVDLVTDLPGQRIPALKRLPGLQVHTDVSQRTLLIGMDQFSDSLRYGHTGMGNPFRDQQVRHAMALAINERTLMRISRNMYQPAGTIVAPGVNGWTEALDRREATNLRQARQLMAQAGHAAGFKVTLDCPNNRYAYDQQICEALVPMWARIGIRVKINSLPFASLVPKLETLDSSLWMLGWGSPDFDALQNLLSLAYTRSDKVDGTYNAARISDPKLDRLIDQARYENNPIKRTGLLQQALEIVKTQSYYLPLAHTMRAWVMQRSISLVVPPSERPEMRFVIVTGRRAGVSDTAPAAPDRAGRNQPAGTRNK